MKVSLSGSGMHWLSLESRPVTHFVMGWPLLLHSLAFGASRTFFFFLALLVLPYAKFPRSFISFWEKVQLFPTFGWNSTPFFFTLNY